MADITTSTEMTQNSHLLPSSSKSRYELTIKIPENLETTFNDAVCIYTVPSSLRKIKPSAYTPQVISIGPIHHGKKSLLKMEIQKLRYFKEFCRRNSPTETLQFSKDLLNQISDEEVRCCYNNDVSYTTEELVNLILLDSVFVIELFLRHLKSPDHLKDFVLGTPWLKADVQQDLILLENQIPFSVLEKLYNFAKGKISGAEDDLESYPSFIDLSCNYFHRFKPKVEGRQPGWDACFFLRLIRCPILIQKKPKVEKFENPQKKILHFTDLVRYFWSYKHPVPEDETIDRLCIITKLNQAWLKLAKSQNKLDDKTIYNLCNITKLYQAGLKLVTSQEKCLLDVEFRPRKSCLTGAVLELPTFEVDDTTEFVVRNVMALEQCHYPAETYVCSYIRLLDLLIDTAEDADLLVEKKIISNGLGNGKAVADLVNKLCDQIVEVKSCYVNVATKLNNYYGSCGNHTMATLRSAYFGDLWKGTGTIAAIVLLVLTLIQTVCSILEVKNGSKGS